VSALPLRFRDATLGALNLFSVSQDPMSEADVMVTRAFADLATLSIVQHRASAEAGMNEQLSAALTSRVVIEQAKGVVAARADVDLGEAFSRLRAYARDNNLRPRFRFAGVGPCRTLVNLATPPSCSNPAAWPDP
jgi:hypothetical protein